METESPTLRSGVAHRAFVGCRTTAARQARGRGIEVFDVLMDGTWHHRFTTLAGVNPSYLAVDSQRRALYCVHGDGDRCSSFRIEPSGSLRPLGGQNTQGTNPVHLTISPGLGWLVIANYASGSVVALKIAADGTLGEVHDRLMLPNRPGPHRTQQQGAHPHQVIFDPSGKWLLVPDKGGDAVHTMTFDEYSGKLQLVTSKTVAPMSGPRHLVFSADGSAVFLVLELASQVLCARFDSTEGTLSPMRRVSTVPEEFTGENTGAGIALAADGSTLCVSNRGHGSIVRFQVGAAHASLSSPRWIDASGKVPRFIASSPRTNTLVVANEDADTIVAMDLTDATISFLAATGSPVCVAFTPPIEGNS